MPPPYCVVYDLDPASGMPIPPVVLAIGGLLAFWTVLSVVMRRRYPDHPGFSPRRLKVFWSGALPMTLGVAFFSLWSEWRAFSEAVEAIQRGRVQVASGIPTDLDREKTSVTFRLEGLEFRVESTRAGVAGYDDDSRGGAIRGGAPLRLRYVDVPRGRFIVGVEVPAGDERCPPAS